MRAKAQGCLVLAGAGLGCLIPALFFIPARSFATATETYIYLPAGAIIGGIVGALVARALR